MSFDQIWKDLSTPSEKLFFSRNDPKDLRMGDLVQRERGKLSLDHSVALLGVPEDEGVRRNNGRPGARKGPDEIRRAFYRLTPYTLKTEESLTSLRVFDFGNLKVRGNLERIHDRLEHIIATIASEGLTPIVFGGGHDITYANALGYSQVAGNFGLMNIDAHFDVREPFPERNSGTAFKMLLEHPSARLRPENFVEFGIQQNRNSLDHYEYLLEKNATVFTLQEIQEQTVERMVSIAYEVAGQNVPSVVVSFDLDAVRSGDAPGVSAPSPVGFSAEEMTAMAYYVGKAAKTGMIDICECNPRYDIDGRTAQLAALLVLSFLTGLANRSDSTSPSLGSQ